MYPELFHISFLHTYGVLVALAFLAGLWMVTRLARQAGLDAEAVFNLGFYCAIAAIAGAKLMMILVDLPYYTEHPREIFSLATLQAGGVFYGGLLAALAVAAWQLRRTSLPALRTADVFAPGIALGHGIGRLGCFSAGCCWGVECHLPWAVKFTDPAANQLVGVPLNLPLHPTQLYESFAEFLHPLLALGQAARAWSDHRPVPHALLHRPVHRGVLPVSRAGHAMGRAVEHFAMAFDRVVPAGRVVVRRGTAARGARTGARGIGGGSDLYRRQ